MNTTFVPTMFMIFGLYHSKERIIEMTEGEISDSNIDLLMDLISHPELCEDVNGFIQQDGILFLNINGNLISVESKI